MSPAIITGLFGLLDRIIPDKDAREKAKHDALILHQSGELKELESRMAAIVAEANSSDPWTSRARPAFLYVFYAILLTMTVFAPILGVIHPAGMELFFTNVGRGFEAIPTELWWTVTAGYLGYGGFRTHEKIKGVSK